MYGEPYETEYMKMRREALTEGRAAEREEILEKLGLTEDAYNQILEGKRKYVLQEVVQPYNAD